MFIASPSGVAALVDSAGVTTDFRLAWPLRKDDTQNREVSSPFFFFFFKGLGVHHGGRGRVVVVGRHQRKPAVREEDCGCWAAGGGQPGVTATVGGGRSQAVTVRTEKHLKFRRPQP